MAITLKRVKFDKQQKTQKQNRTLVQNRTEKAHHNRTNDNEENVKACKRKISQTITRWMDG